MAATRNILLPSANNLTLDPTKNIVLEPLIVRRFVQGYSRVRNTTHCTQQGQSKVLSLHPKNLVVLGGGLWLLSGNNLVLQRLPVSRTSKGGSFVYNTITRPQLGRSMVFGVIGQANVGSSQVGYENIPGTGPSGISRIYASTNSTRKGQSFVRAIFGPVRVGKSLVYENYRPIVKQGYSLIFDAMGKTAKGRSRTANDAVAGYVVYVGYGQRPDFTQDPDGFDPTRPVEVDVVPPFSGTYELQVVMRQRSKYGLEGGDVVAKTITIDTNGDEVLGPVSAPFILNVLPADDEYFSLFIKYPGYETDPNPGDETKVYVNEGAPPVPGVDTPAAVVGVRPDLGVMVGPYPTGSTTYYFAVTIFRTENSEESEAATAALVLGDDPLTPRAVKGGFEVR